MVTTTRKHRVNGFELAELPAVWGKGSAFHQAECQWASPDPDTGTFADAVRLFKAPCLSCWRTVSSPARLLRVSMAILRDEYAADPFPAEVEAVMWTDPSESEAMQ